MKGQEGPPTLLTDRLLLRPLTLQDAEAVFAYTSDPEVMRYLNFEAHRTMEDTRAFLRSVTEGYAHGKLVRGIVLRADGRLVGTCGLRISREHERGELGYWLHRDCWGRGLVPEAVGAVIRHAFEHERLQRIQARCAAENAASARVMEKAGMTYEGTLRRYERIGGELRDMRFYAILQDEWADPNHSRKR
jgi:ribosomal-protein-alanine N-acetyltransferase